MTKPIACIGAANIDVKAHCLAPVVLESSNPVRVEENFGGVARNVCETLARLGAQTCLIAPLGKDDAAARLTDHLTQLGAQLLPLKTDNDQPTARYIALLDPKGDLTVGMADMAIADSPTVETVKKAAETLSVYPYWFMDTNLPALALAHIAQAKPAGTVLAADCVSVAKAPRLTPLLGQLDLLFCNADEAAALTSASIHAPLDVITAANRLRDLGVGTAIVSQGADGCYVASDTINTFVPAFPVPVRDVTGAGDALAAGTVFGLAAGMEIDQAVKRGLAAAALTCQTADTVSPQISQSTLERMITDAE